MWQLVVHVNFTATLVFFCLCLDLENDMSAFKGGIIGRQALLSPTEYYELLFVLLRKLIEELPEVLDEGAILKIVWVVSWILCVASEQSNVWQTTAANPRLQIVLVANVEHAFRNDLAQTASDGLHLLLSLRQSCHQSLSDELEPILKFNLSGITVAILRQI